MDGLVPVVLLRAADIELEPDSFLFFLCHQFARQSSLHLLPYKKFKNVLGLPGIKKSFKTTFYWNALAGSMILHRADPSRAEIH